MQTLKTDTGHTVRYYTDLTEFPAERRAWLTKYSIEASELDTTPQGLGERIGIISQAIVDNRLVDAQTGLQNLFVGIMGAHAGYAPDALTFGCLIHDVDGVLIDDLSADGLMQVINKLDVSTGEMGRIVESVKKNSQSTESIISLGLTTTALSH